MHVCRWATLALLALPSLAADSFRAPAVPLVACDPYFSIWSPADTLAGADTTHWTGKPHRLTGLARIDGRAYRILGAQPADLPVLAQQSVAALPTRTIYTFSGDGVSLTLTFLTPLLPEDLDLLARPVTYVIWEWVATDGRAHEVACYFDAAAELAVNEPGQAVNLERGGGDGISFTRIGSADQSVLGRSGDDLRIDWGYLYVATGSGAPAEHRILPADLARGAFMRGAEFPLVKQAMPQPAGQAASATVEFPAHTVGAQSVCHVLMLAYDDLFSIQYMKQNLRPYWRRNGWEAADLLRASAAEFESLRDRCAAFDAELMADFEKIGGTTYARLAALAYRQCFAAGKFVADAHGQPLQFSKENHSNGCIGTADVLYPMAPQFLLFGPTLTKSFLVPFMNYAASERWKFPFAPHDLGTYPQANGQRYGGGERTEENQMPVEESGNILLLMAALAQLEGNADFAGRYWPQLNRWADYLEAKGFDPEHQLCTDDFAGHLAHNVNLSAKAICALGAFGQLCARRGETGRAAHFTALARTFAERWVKEAADGDHTKLAFDRPGTWSQKYNLVWDRLLGLNLFPPAVLRQEMAHYRRVQNPYGLPLDSRKTYTKLDWTVWTATLTGDRADFEALVEPIGRFLADTPQRSPMTDWYETKTAAKVAMTARPVVGGVLLPLLYDAAIWKKYAGRERVRAADWAPMPRPPQAIPLVPSAAIQPATWRYTTQAPAAGWMEASFDDAAWAEGRSGFGTAGTPGAVIGTVWNTPAIWLRRVVTIPDPRPARLGLRLHHDEEVEVFINGRLAAKRAGYTMEYELVELTAEGQAALRAGPNVLAVHCRQTVGGQYVDVGLDVVVDPLPR